MAKKLSQAGNTLGLGAATIAGSVALLGKEGGATTHGQGPTQYQPAAGQQKSYGGRPIGKRVTAAD